MEHKYLKPDYIFEVSWEVCNKVGGIHTVLSTKSISLSKNCGKLILIGPDVWRDNEEHPEFEEDNSLFSDWKRKLDSENLRVRVGRWKIPGNPVALLVDFSNYISQKDQIFYEFWEKYKLDSLSGQWDYIEPALFGYASGKVIESFVRFYSSIHDKIIAHFHEWMTGTGILYLKNEMPQIATAFTTHATVIGRCVAGNRMPLYKNLDKLNGDLLSVEFNIVSKQSLEKISAQNADVFTTVSEITAQECIQFLGKNVDKITPNGFEDNFVPVDEEYIQKRLHARKLFISVAEALADYKFEHEPIIVATSGRYEFYNKGYDLFIDSLGQINKSKSVKKEVLAYILVPANHYGPIKNLYNKINKIEGDQHILNKYLTHNLHDPEYDPILRRLAENELFNSPDDKVKVVFVPSYLNGDDGIFNTKYYDLLPGLDLTAFVSYYEPWGYTPLESTAFGIPTITTSLAGFGKWMKNYSETEKCVKVIDRTDENSDFVITEIVNNVENFSRLTDGDIEVFRKCAKNAASKALWKNLIYEYLEAYNIAFQKIKERHDIILRKPVIRKITETAVSEVQEPVWRKIEVQTILPEKFKCLDKFALNLWWSWNPKAAKMFKYISPELWKKSEYNPVVFLDSISSERLSELENDACFIKMYEEVCNDFQVYMKEAENKKPPKIAYFSMEFGLIDSIKIFSGGLGILAGDYLKEASDSNIDMVGIGLLYRYGYFKQKLTSYGDQQAEYIPQNFDKMPILPVRDANGAQLKTAVNFPGRTVYVKIWEVNVGRVKLYLLDTDTEDNQEQDRYITSQLYGGDSEMRFKQEMILGVAGVRALHELKIYPDVYHCNEGHAAFIGLERLRLLRTKRNLKFDEALEIIRASTLFTTHTPVPAGHDAFDENLMRVYMAHYPERLKITWEEMMKLGKLKPEEKFSMSYLASNVSQEINGVSKLHGEVSKKMFVDLWPGYFAMENHVGYVTNGVHFKTWAAKEWQELYLNTFGLEFLNDLSNPDHWRKIHDVDDAVIWKLRQHFRRKLVNYVKEKAKQNIIRRYDDPKYLVDIQEKINEHVLTIGFARRFATYKRGDLLLRNPDRLARILNNKNMPVQILFAGKAHPNDLAGQKLIKRIVEMSKMPAFLGKIIFIEDYDINLAKKLVQGVDIWLNTPTRPMEASGTSGMKAVMNGVLHFSVLDGWWVEGYRENAGWALPAERTYQNQDFQNELDAQVIFSLLENEIVPLFYNRDENGIPHEWIKIIKNSIAEIAPQFTTKRMIDDYIQKYYFKLYDRSLEMKKNEYEMAVKIAEWKRNVRRIWDDVKVISARFPDYETQPMNLNENFYGEVTLDLNMLSPEDVGVEVVVTDSTDKINANILAKYPGKLVEINNKIARYEIVGSTKKPGFYNYAVRIYAKNDLLPYPQDSGLVKWV